MFVHQLSLKPCFKNQHESEFVTRFKKVHTEFHRKRDEKIIVSV